MKKLVTILLITQAWTTIVSAEHQLPPQPGARPLTPASPLFSNAPMVPKRSHIKCETSNDAEGNTYYLEIIDQAATLTVSQPGATGYDYNLQFGKENLAEGTMYSNSKAELFVQITPPSKNQNGRIGLIFSTGKTESDFKNVLFNETCSLVE